MLLLSLPWYVEQSFDEFDTKERKNSAYLSFRNLLPQPLLLLAGLGREVLPEIR
jgi:hypothetical protein